MLKRTITGILILMIFIPLILIEDLFPLFQTGMILLAGLSTFELIKMYEKEKKFSLSIKIVIMLCAMLMYLASLVEWQPQSLPSQTLQLFNIRLKVLPVSIIILLVLFSCTVFVQSFDGADVGKALLIVLYSGVGFSSITILKYLGNRYIVYLFLITVLTDVFAYITGMLFGKHKMAPKISPKKTWEGAIGGTIVASIFGCVFALFYGDLFGSFFGNQETLLDGIINVDKLSQAGQIIILVVLTVLTSIISQIGDLVASRLKRTYDIKDFGNCFPGHGGVLDRLDSALFASMFILAVFTFLNYLLPIATNGNLGMII